MSEETKPEGDGVVAWYLNCEDPETGIKYRSVTFNASDVTASHRPLVEPRPAAEVTDADIVWFIDDAVATVGRQDGMKVSWVGFDRNDRLAVGRHILASIAAHPYTGYSAVPDDFDSVWLGSLFLHLLELARRVPGWTGSEVPAGCCSDQDFNDAIEQVCRAIGNSLIAATPEVPKP